MLIKKLLTRKKMRRRDFGKDKGKNSISRKEVVGITKYGEEHILAEFRSTAWSLMDSQWSLQLQKILNKEGHLFELTGCRTHYHFLLRQGRGQLYFHSVIPYAYPREDFFSERTGPKILSALRTGIDLGFFDLNELSKPLLGEDVFPLVISAEPRLPALEKDK